MEPEQSNFLRFQGCAHFRQRLVCATLSGKKVLISNIRADDLTPGLQDFEVSFLRLLDKVTNGTLIEINETGTELKYKPGTLVGGKHQHTCPPSRGIGYFIEGLMGLTPFAKNPTSVSFTGVTNHPDDLSVDVLRTVTIPLLAKFGVTMTLKTQQKGMPPLGGGQVQFSSQNVRELTPIQVQEQGKVKKIRGIAYSARVTPQTSNRIVDATKQALKPYTSNVYLNTDHYKGKDAGLSPGFGVILVAETTTGSLYATEAIGSGGMLPEAVGEMATKQLMEEIYRGGCVDTSNQTLVLLYMLMCPEDVSKLVLGSLSEYTIQYLRHLRDFFGTKFKIVPDRESGTITLSCLGIGATNVSKKMY